MEAVQRALLIYSKTTFCGNEEKATEPKWVCAITGEYSPTKVPVFSR